MNTDLCSFINNASIIHGPTVYGVSDIMLCSVRAVCARQVNVLVRVEHTHIHTHRNNCGIKTMHLNKEIVLE